MNALLTYIIQVRNSLKYRPEKVEKGLKTQASELQIYAYGGGKAVNDQMSKIIDISASPLWRNKDEIFQSNSKSLLYTIPVQKYSRATRYKEEVVPDHKEARGYNRVKKSLICLDISSPKMSDLEV